MGFTVRQMVLIAGMLVSGSINTISKSAQNHSRQAGQHCTFFCWEEDGNRDMPFPTRADCVAHGYTWTCKRPFDAPWFQTLIMFVGEALALIGYWYSTRTTRKAAATATATGESKPLLSGVVNATAGDTGDAEYGAAKDSGSGTRHSHSHSLSDATALPKFFQPVLLLPTCCDLAGTTLAGIGLLYVQASVWQMLRGSIIIFTGLFSVVFLKRRLRPYHWLGMLITSVGLLLVGLASIFSVESAKAGENTHSKAQTVLGILLILGAQVVSATQMVIEETFLKSRKLPPLQVVGLEGTFGALLMAFLVLPVVYLIPGPQPSHFKHGSYENSIDAAFMIRNNHALLALCLLYCFSITFYNFCGLAVTKSLSAVHRTLVDACRTLLVWGAELFLHYALSLAAFGEPWTKFSFMQLGGFAFLVTGTMLYNRVIRIRALGSDFDESTGVAAAQDSESES